MYVMHIWNLYPKKQYWKSQHHQFFPRIFILLFYIIYLQWNILEPDVYICLFILTRSFIHYLPPHQIYLSTKQTNVLCVYCSYNNNICNLAWNFPLLLQQKVNMVFEEYYEPSTVLYSTKRGVKSWRWADFVYGTSQTSYCTVIAGLYYIQLYVSHCRRFYI